MVRLAFKFDLAFAQRFFGSAALVNFQFELDIGFSQLGRTLSNQFLQLIVVFSQLDLCYRPRWVLKSI